MKYIQALHFARELRKNPTSSESILWETLRKRRFQGFRFLRQYKIEHCDYMGEKGYYFADFYCHELKLIIEVDGEIHNSQTEYDQQRDSILTSMQYNVFRLKNNEVNSKKKLGELEKYCIQLGQAKKS